MTTRVPTIAVLGGGFSGAMFAAHLLRAARAPLEVVVVEPRDAIGGGLAYGSAAPEHRINVPSDKMVVFSEDPTHLSRWVRDQGLFDSDPEAVTPEGHHYTRRRDFARYVADVVDQARRTAPAGSALRHVQPRAIDIVPTRRGHRVTLDTPDGIDADAVVVAASHETPSFPWPLGDGARDHRGLVRDPWAQLPTLPVEDFDPGATIVIAGTGLTMCDAVVSLRQRGFQGALLAVSRRALLPQVQGVFVDGFDLLRGQPLPGTARHLLRRVREAVGRASDWREALDATRLALPQLWQALPMAERRRALHRLRPFWDVHRFRMAPQVDALLRRERARGTLRIAHGRIRAIETLPNGSLVVRWQAPGGSLHPTACAAFVNCTGPSSDMRRAANPLMQALLARGLAVPDPVGMGLEGDADGRLRAHDGKLADRLCVAGPLARAVLAEVTGVPEASAHARRVAERLAAELTQPSLHPSMP
jgi:uncharacterized NAD(P)/FAD-binding protein YdhS